MDGKLSHMARKEKSHMLPCVPYLPVPFVSDSYVQPLQLLLCILFRCNLLPLCVCVYVCVRVYAMASNFWGSVFSFRCVMELSPSDF